MRLGSLPRYRPLLALAVVALALGLTGIASAHASTHPAPHEGQAVIRSEQLAVTVDRGFPAVRGYEWRATGAHLGGAAGTPDQIEVNGMTYTLPHGTSGGRLPRIPRLPSTAGWTAAGR